MRRKRGREITSLRKRKWTEIIDPKSNTTNRKRYSEISEKWRDGIVGLAKGIIDVSLL